MKQFLLLTAVTVFAILTGLSLATAATTLFPSQGGTGLTSNPSYGQVLVGNSSGGYTLTATSSLGISGGAGNSFSYPFPSDATTTVLKFTGGFSVGSSTPMANSLLTVGTSTWTGIHVNSNTGQIGFGCINSSAAKAIFDCGTNANVNPNIKFLVQDAADARLGVAAADIGVFMKSHTGTAAGGLFAYNYALGAARSLILNEFGGNVGVGTTSPWRNLSVYGNSDLGTNALAGSFTATTTVASTFPNASTTHISSSGQFFGKDGTEAAPAYSFTSDTNTGMDLVSGGTLGFIIDGTGRLALNSSGVYPYTNDAASVGIAGNAFSDAYLASGGVLNFGNGDVDLTHTTGNLTLSSADRFNATYASTTGLTSATAWFTSLFIGADTIAEYIADAAGAMFTGNTETGVIATYQDSDNTIDLVLDMANANTWTATQTFANTVTTNATTASLYIGSHHQTDFFEFTVNYSTTTQGVGTTTKPVTRTMRWPGTLVDATCYFNKHMRVLVADTAGNRMNDMVASSTSGTHNFSTNNTFTAGETLEFYVGTTTASLNTVYGNCTYRARYN